LFIIDDLWLFGFVVLGSREPIGALVLIFCSNDIWMWF